MQAKVLNIQVVVVDIAYLLMKNFLLLCEDNLEMKKMDK